MRIARFAVADGVAYGVVEGEFGQPQTIAELHGHPFGVDPAGVRFSGEPLSRWPRCGCSPRCCRRRWWRSARTTPSTSRRWEARELPAEPVLFLKPSTSVTGPGDRIAYPVKITDRVDYEGELAVIIGRLCRDVPKERAADVIFGYTCANDVTARDLQARDGQWTRAKGFDTFCPLGPWMETGADPADLGITTTVNGAVKQHARTSELLWDVPVAGRVRVLGDDPAARRRAADRHPGGRRPADRRRRGVGHHRVDRHPDQPRGHPRLTSAAARRGLRGQVVAQVG